MKLILVDIIFLIALLLVANKFFKTWRMLFPQGLAHWRAERKKIKEIHHSSEE